jgi:uncharacterized membrane protein
MNISNFICHRRPDRSFNYNGKQFPVCARCTGFYLGLLLFSILFFFNLSYDFYYLGLLLLVPMGVDGTTQLFKLRESNNMLRLVTGLVAGAGVILMII